MSEPGDLIGPYRLVSQLGAGAMGEVWRARDERLDRYVALKILPAAFAGDLERRARMLREARAAAAIRHPNVVTLFDIVSDADGHRGEDILVMELVEGRTLFDVLRREGAPELPTALRWLEQIADALAAAHARGVLHRDLKAANIMVAGDTIKVLDFGLAKLASDPSSSLPAPEAPRNASDVPGASFSQLATAPSSLSLDSYRTHAGQLLGTPMYMAPEQVEGAQPDERSEVFSTGVLAFEILTGKPPHTATSLDQLFLQITTAPVPALPAVPDAVEAIVKRALAKDPAARYPSMAALRDAIAAERQARFGRRTRVVPLVVAALGAAAFAAAAVAYLHRGGPGPAIAPARPGDQYVARALDEYDVFYTDKALSSLRAALAVAPDHPRATAYLVLFGGSADDVATAVAAAPRARATAAAGSKDRALLDAALALAERGPLAARSALAAAGAPADRELAFWAAELDYRAGHYLEAAAGYKALLDAPGPTLRGRIYDHDSSVLLYLDEPAEALRVGTLYRDAFPGEADAVGVYATTLAASGRYPEAIAAAESALRLSEGEDTLAGLAKVLALSGDHARAKALYQRSLDRAGPSRRPLRRAALALLQWIDGDVAAALATVTPCLPGGADSSARERGACLFVAGVLDPSHADAIARDLDALAAAATPAAPAYGDPAGLAALVRARTELFGGGCVIAVPPRASVLPPADATRLAAIYTSPPDFYASYHVPFFATWPLCEHAAVLAATGDRAAAAQLLSVPATKAPGRTWLAKTRALIVR